jgi:vacuolar-type H+-ATPase subunit E/Vma4
MESSFQATERWFHHLSSKENENSLSNRLVIRDFYLNLQHETLKRKEKAMSSATLTNLRDYLTGTLSPANLLWLSEQLADYAKKKAVPPCRLTLKEMNAILDRAEEEIAAGWEHLTKR